MPWLMPLASRHSLSKASDPSIMIVPLAVKLMCCEPPTENENALELAWAGGARPTMTVVAVVAATAEAVVRARIRMVASLRGWLVGPPSEGVLARHLGPACKRLESPLRSRGQSSAEVGIR